MELEGAVVVVTGAGSGIGRASALAFAAAGATVVAADIDAVALGTTMAMLDGGPASAALVDVRMPDSVEELLDLAIARHGRLDVLHNNAGLVGGEPAWPAMPVERIADLVAVNVLGVMVGTRLALDRMTGGGAIVNTASIAGLAPMPTDPVYAATKAAIISFTQSCAAMAATNGIRVNAVLPGMVDTPMLAKTGDGTRPAAWLAPLVDAGVPLKPDHVAAVVLGLVRDDSCVGETSVILEPPSDLID